MNFNAYHFVGKALRDGSPVPSNGETLRWGGPLEMCQSGLHASRKPWQALVYARGNTLCRVHCGGKIIATSDKLVCRERTICARIDATDLLRSYARKCALDVAHLWECPPIMLEYLKTGDEWKRAAAGDAARTARDAAWDADWTARATGAAGDAAGAARAADWATGAAAGDEWKRAAAGDAARAAGAAAGAAAWAAGDAAGAGAAARAAAGAVAGAAAGAAWAAACDEWKRAAAGDAAWAAAGAAAGAKQRRAFTRLVNTAFAA